MLPSSTFGEERQTIQKDKSVAIGCASTAGLPPSYKMQLYEEKTISCCHSDGFHDNTPACQFHKDWIILANPPAQPGDWERLVGCETDVGIGAEEKKMEYGDIITFYCSP